jgi:uncharacterized membrane protein
VKNKEVPDWVESTLSGYLLEDEEALNHYTNGDKSILVTDRRLINIKKRGNDSEVESTSLKGNHVIGSDIKKSYSGIFMGIILCFSAGFAFGFDFKLIALVFFTIGMFLLYFPDKQTKIKIKMKKGEEDVEYQIPEDAEHLGQTVSKQVAENM